MLEGASDPSKDLYENRIGSIIKLYLILESKMLETKIPND
jgi:hypothetical protein